jgi:hypothetical protein
MKMRKSLVVICDIDGVEGRSRERKWQLEQLLVSISTIKRVKSIEINNKSNLSYIFKLNDINSSNQAHRNLKTVTNMVLFYILILRKLFI